MKNESPDPLLFQVFNEIGIIDQLSRARLQSVLPDGLKISQFIVLNHLLRLGGKWSPVRLAGAFQVTKAAITNTLKKLEARGLIQVEADPADGRGKLVSLTANGQQMRELCIASIQPFMVDLQQRFGEDVFAEALPFLRELRVYLDDKRGC